MTREEARKELVLWRNRNSDNGYHYKFVEALTKVLEQDSALDKIREEINGMYRVILKDTPKDGWAVKWNNCLDEVLQIIDKYKIKSEE